LGKNIIVIGGPNGAGKTTAAQGLLPERLAIREFINADEIARGISPFSPENAARGAGRFMIERMRSLVRENRDFAFETTCSGRTLAALLRRCKVEGWRITLLYLWLPSPRDALDRVARRVRQGGHGIPADVVVRRYWSGLRNLHKLYLPLADLALIYDNSDAGRVLIAELAPGEPIAIHDLARWTAMSEVAR
jgi:predicted ABC-type ATPase